MCPSSTLIYFMIQGSSMIQKSSRNPLKFQSIKLNFELVKNENALHLYSTLVLWPSLPY